jgi:hypothetical protein
MSAVAGRSPDVRRVTICLWYDGTGRHSAVTVHRKCKRVSSFWELTR